MRSQREALQTILDSFDTSFARELRLIFLSEWLEDINWHAENSLLWESVPEVLSSAALALLKERSNILETLEPTIHLANRIVTTDNLRYNLKKIESYQTFSLIFGYGLNNDSFTFAMGRPLVNDLLAMAGIVPVEATTCPDCGGADNSHLRASCNE